MNTETEFKPETTGAATYSPESNKLHLYVGRVPRPEYDYLHAQGWKSTPKQSEAGGGEFAATWTPARRKTALAYGGGFIGDEDQSPAERAALRAERFSGYRDKRTNEATRFADNYEAGPSAHGYQNQERAERAAARHDRIGDKVTDAWEKAEYWTSRTAGVISNALYKSRPDVRMGRIKVLETELRRLAGTGGEWEKHLTLRLAYENQMLDAQGGRAAHIEIVAGGLWGGKLIVKACKSPVTGRTVSVFVKGPKVTGWQYMTRNVAGADYSLHQFETERADSSFYTPPTPESLAELAALKAEKKAKTPAKPACPLINPTDEDAERLLAILNARACADWVAYEPAYRDAKDFKPSTVCRISQARYSELSKGAHARVETKKLCADATFEPRQYFHSYDKQREDDAKRGPVLCQLRRCYGDGNTGNCAPRIIILTDKPQKPLPAAVWEKYVAPATPELVTA